jgi:hypothetical protein
VLLYGSDSWTTKSKDKARLISAEMKFMRRTAAYIWSDFKQNTEILEEIKVGPIQDNISNYKTDGQRHSLSSFARTLGSWVQIAFKAWMSACIYSVFVQFCV